ncbi:MAG: ribonuclease R [Sedimentisphaerales bacterium]|nr:ribonuclease R [Sedimentisphaerales bacterium]
MIELFKERILQILQRRDYQPVKLAALAKSLGISNADFSEFKKAFDELRESGQVVIGSGNFITLPAISTRITGTFRANPKGFGFIVPLQANTYGDLFIPPNETAGAMTGDIVEARVLKKVPSALRPGSVQAKLRTGKRQGQLRYTGRIVEILERAQNRFVGTLLSDGKNWYVQPDGKSFTEPIFIEDISAKNARARDKVVVEILSYPTEQHHANGVIVEMLGKAGRYESEIASVIRQFHIPYGFSSEHLEQARKAAENFKPDDIGEREDICGKTIITIDPEDAKDFDDAISLDKDQNGNRVLGIHIADVSSFIATDTSLDEEAKLRGNSVYLPQRTIPMLPEILSNGICSLQPKQKRYCKSVYITYDDEGKILNRRFANSIICSSARLTYRQADRILKGHTKDFSKEFIGLLKEMEALSRIIEQRRKKNGMLHLDLPEIELIFDNAGQVVDAEPADTSYPHTIIEMFMVEANEAVASLIDGLNIVFMRRIHPEPNELGFKELARLLKTLGIKLGKNPDRFTLQSLLESVQGKDCELAVNLLVLRSLEKAVYSPMNIGHYALAGRHYCHFTSPIRRYADLLVHRILDSHLRGEDIEAVGTGGLNEIGKHITFTEERAEDAERELKAVLILQMLQKHIGDELDCVVTGMAGFGVFARSKKYGIEGLIQLEELGDDNWKFDQKGYCIVGLNTGYNIHLGDRIKARILSVNIPARQMNLTPAEPLVKQKPQKSKHPGKYPRKRATGRRGKGRSPRRSTSQPGR